MKSITVLTIAVLLSLALSLQAQPELLWSRTFGGEATDECYFLAQRADGGFTLGGKTRSLRAGLLDFWVVRTDENGDSLRSLNLGRGVYSFTQTRDEGFALAGYTSRYNEQLDIYQDDIWLERDNENGHDIWYYTYEEWNIQRPYSLTQTANGGFAVAGISGYYGYLRLFHGDYYLQLTDEDGERLWSRTYEGEGNDICTSLIQTVDGGFALAGFTEYSFPGGQKDFWLVRTDENGDSLWSSRFGGRNGETCNSLIQTVDGGFALAGYTSSFSAGRTDFWLVRTDEDGDSLWSKTYGGEGADVCNSILQTEDGGFLLAGYTDSFGAGGRDFWLVRTDENGDSLWSRTFGGRENESCRSLVQTADGGFALAGSTTSYGAGSSDFWLVKTGPDPVSAPPVSTPIFPSDLTLLPPYPNPFNSTTTIRFALPKPGMASIMLVDPLGRRVQEMTPSGWFEAGWHSLSLDAAHLPAGKYFVVLSAGEYVLETPVTLVR